MAKTYKAFYDKQAKDLYRDLVIGRQPETLDSPATGLGGRPAQSAPAPQQEELSLFDSILQRMGLYSDEPEAVANAVAPDTPNLPRAPEQMPTLQRTRVGGVVPIRSWEDLPPAPSSRDFNAPVMDLTQTSTAPDVARPDPLTMASMEGSTQGAGVEMVYADGQAANTTSAYDSGREDRTATSIREANTERETFSGNFFTNIGVFAETDHGDTPQVSNDAADSASGQTTYDIGYGHKITSAEFESGEIHGIQFIDDSGNYIPLTQEQKEEIMQADFEMHTQAAREAGWDKELENRGSSWDELDTPYQNALASLAYNVGGNKAGQQWSNIFEYAIAGSRATNNEEEQAAIRGFARHLRRKDAGRNTAGMDNRVAKELYFAGLIDSLADVSSVLTLANAEQAGIPATAEYGSNPNRRPSGSQD
jgi:GH24 family phage-related lysozyme (muramidase)